MSSGIDQPPTVELAVQEYIRYPPFPVPPPGKKILSFSEFKPSGIQIAIDPEPGYVEQDGHGIPTVALRVKHDLTETERKKKRGKASRTVAGAGGQTRRLTWWEEWEEGEELRRASPCESVSLNDRLYNACQDFKSSRQWPQTASGVPQLWEIWRLYVGIISSIQPPGQRKIKNVPDPEEEDSEDEDINMADGKPQEQTVMMVEEESDRQKIEDERRIEAAKRERERAKEDARQQQRERREEMKDARMVHFFNETEDAVKIFFSAFFRDKGYIWSEQRCRDAPILIEFFLRFVLRNRLFPEYEAGIKKALEVCKIARHELPATSVVGKALPDAFSEGCVALMGRFSQAVFAVSSLLEETSDGAEPEAKKRKLDEPDEPQGLKEFKASVGQSNLEFIDANVDHEAEMTKTAVADNVDVNGVEVAPGKGWGTIDGASGTWNIADIGAGGDQVNSNGWGANDDGGWGTGGWNTEAENTWYSPPKNQLLPLLGPTVLPLTHTTGLMERSVRRIVKVVPPSAEGAVPKAKGQKGKGQEIHAAAAVEDELERRLGYMVMAPWVKIGNHVASDIVTPSFLPDSRGAVVHVPDKIKHPDTATAPALATDGPPPFDPTKDEIVVPLDPETLAKLTVGMGVNGTWIQLARREPGVVDGSETPSVGPVEWNRDKTNRKLGGPGKNAEPTKWWYMEQLHAVLCSFHIDRYYPDQD